MVHQKSNNSWVETVSDSYAKERTALIKKSAKMTGKNIQIIAGIPCEEPSKINKTTFLESFLKEAEEEMSIRKTLRDHGLKVEGLLPTAILKEMIKPLPFYTFKNINNEGKVKANGKKFMKAEDGRQSIVTSLLTIVFSIISCFFAFNNLTEYPVLMPLIKFLSVLWSGISLIFCGFLIFLSGVPSTNQEENVYTRMDNIKVYTIMILVIPFAFFFYFISEIIKPLFIRKHFKKRLLWPSKSDTENVSGDWVGIALPPAPKEIQIALLKLQKSELKVKSYLIVHEDAFKPVMDGETMKSLMVKYDPIVCFDIGNFTILYRQYGDFEHEKKLGEAIKERFNVIKEKYLMPSN